MTRLLVFSDSHSEFGVRAQKLPPIPNDSLFDVVVSAGDINYGIDELKTLEQMFPNHPIVAVVGNHTYYTRPFKQTADELRSYGGHVQLMNPGVVKFENITFIGATHWSDLQLEGFYPLSDNEVKRGISDFRWGWTPREMRIVHASETAFLEKELALQNVMRSGPVVVVTHFVPTQLCTSPRFIGDPYNPYFLNDMDWMMDKYKPDAWIFGHTHDRFDIQHPSGTRVVGNPVGYRYETPDFEWKILEI